jgi:hypothetical protein
VTPRPLDPAVLGGAQALLVDLDGTLVDALERADVIIEDLAALVVRRG